MKVEATAIIGLLAAMMLASAGSAAAQSRKPVVPFGTVIVNPAVGGAFVWPGGRAFQQIGVRAETGLLWRFELSGGVQMRWAAGHGDHLHTHAELVYVAAGGSERSRLVATVGGANLGGLWIGTAGVRGTGIPDLGLGSGAADFIQIIVSGAMVWAGGVSEAWTEGPDVILELALSIPIEVSFQ